MNMSLDLYIDYLICSTSYTTAMGLSRITNKVISHDKVTKFLSSKDYTASDLWKIAKPFCESIETEDGVLIIDDSIEEKPYTDENELISWHFSHTKSRSVKGINFVSALYYTSKGSAPVGYELVRKTEEVINKKTGKKQRKSPVSKQKYYRNLTQTAVANNINFKYVLNDSWFSSAENMNFVKIEVQKDFVMPIKANRKVALSEADKALGHFVGIDLVKPGENTLVRLEGVDFPLRFARQVFKNEDGSTGVLYLVSSDIELTNEQIETIYKRRWKVETYHQSLKNNASLAKSPTKTPRTQANHLFASLCAYIRLERISNVLSCNHFALKLRIYIEALKRAMLELQKFNTLEILQTANFASAFA
jgi:DDE superfamily endonuclease